MKQMKPVAILLSLILTLSVASIAYATDDGVAEENEQSQEPLAATSEEEVAVETNTTAIENGWYPSDNNRVQYYENWLPVLDAWRYLDNNWYYFDSDGNMVTADGFQVASGDYYSFDEAGLMKTGWVKTTEGIWLYHNAEGTALKGWKYLNSKWYYFASEMNPLEDSELTPGPYMAYGRQKVSGVTYLLSDASDGSMKTGWSLRNGIWHYYHLYSGAMFTSSWSWINGCWYYFDASGIMASGDAYQVSSDKYYSFYSSGAMRTGWVKTSDGAWLYHDPSGAALMGWQKLSATWYYFASAKHPAPDSDLTAGIYMAYGTQRIGNAEYHLNGSDSGAMKTGWVQASDVWYYYHHNSGAMVKDNWVKVGAHWYLMDAEGKMMTGWAQRPAGIWYYLHPNGTMASGPTVYAPYPGQPDYPYSDFTTSGRWIGYSKIISGIDVSGWQPAGIGSMVDYDFLIVKATGGTGYVNPYMDIQAGAALARSKQLGFYHFANDGYWGSAIAEADWFVSKVKPYTNAGNAVLFLDYEMELPGSDRQWIIDFCKRVKEKTGVTCHIYASSSWATSYIPGLWNELDCWLWQANYWSGYTTFWGYNPDFGHYAVSPQNGMRIHQYTSTGRLSGYGGVLDFNTYYGTTGEWLYYKTH